MTTVVASSPTSLEEVQTNRHLPLSEPWQQDKDQQVKTYNAQTAKLLQQKGFSKEAERIEACGTVFGYWACRHDGTPGRMVKSFCGLDRLCPQCARIRRRALVAEIMQDAGRISSRPVLGFRWRVICLTAKTDGRYRETAQKVLKAFSKLWRGYLKGAQRRPTACLVHLENGPKTGNVHLHVLFYGPYIPQSELSDAWAKLTGSSVVDVREVGQHELEQAIDEAVKYMVKFSEVSNSQLIELWQANKGLRLLRRYGLFRRDVLDRWVKPGVVRAEQEVEPVCAVCGRSHWRYVSLKDAPRGPPTTIQVVE